jgi:predicted transcriptional regulator
MVPSAVAWLFDEVCAGEWPMGDEDKIRAMAAGWDQIGVKLRAVGFDDLTNMVGANVGGMVGRGFFRSGLQLAGAQGQLTGSAVDQAAMLQALALAIETTKIGMLEALVLTAADVAWATWTFGAELLIPGFVAAGRVVVQTLSRRLLDVAVTIAEQAAYGAGMAGLQTVVPQLIEMERHLQSGLADGLGPQIALGALGGGLGFGLHSLGERLVPQLFHDLPIVSAALMGAAAGEMLALLSLPWGGNSGALGWAATSGGLIGGSSHALRGLLGRGGGGESPSLDVRFDKPATWGPADLTFPSGGEKEGLPLDYRSMSGSVGEPEWLPEPELLGLTRDYSGLDRTSFGARDVGAGDVGSVRVSGGLGGRSLLPTGHTGSTTDGAHTADDVHAAGVPAAGATRDGQGTAGGAVHTGDGLPRSDTTRLTRVSTDVSDGMPDRAGDWVSVGAVDAPSSATTTDHEEVVGDAPAHLPVYTPTPAAVSRASGHSGAPVRTVPAAHDHPTPTGAGDGMARPSHTPHTSEPGAESTLESPLGAPESGLVPGGVREVAAPSGQAGLVFSRSGIREHVSHLSDQELTNYVNAQLQRQPWFGQDDTVTEQAVAGARAAVEEEMGYRIENHRRLVGLVARRFWPSPPDAPPRDGLFAGSGRHPGSGRTDQSRYGQNAGSSSRQPTSPEQVGGFYWRMAHPAPAGDERGQAHDRARSESLFGDESDHQPADSGLVLPGSHGTSNVFLPGHGNPQHTPQPQPRPAAPRTSRPGDREPSVTDVDAFATAQQLMRGRLGTHQASQLFGIADRRFPYLRGADDPALTDAQRQSVFDEVQRLSGRPIFDGGVWLFIYRRYGIQVHSHEIDRLNNQYRSRPLYERSVGSDRPTFDPRNENHVSHLQEFFQGILARPEGATITQHQANEAARTKYIISRVEGHANLVDKLFSRERAKAGLTVLPPSGRRKLDLGASDEQEIVLQEYRDLLTGPGAEAVDVFQAMVAIRKKFVITSDNEPTARRLFTIARARAGFIRSPERPRLDLGDPEHRDTLRQEYRDHPDATRMTRNQVLMFASNIFKWRNDDQRGIVELHREAIDDPSGSGRQSGSTRSEMEVDHDQELQGLAAQADDPMSIDQFQQLLRDPTPAALRFPSHYFSPPPMRPTPPPPGAATRADSPMPTDPVQWPLRDSTPADFQAQPRFFSPTPPPIMRSTPHFPGPATRADHDQPTVTGPFRHNDPAPNTSNPTFIATANQGNAANLHSDPTPQEFIAGLDDGARSVYNVLTSRPIGIGAQMRDIKQATGLSEKDIYFHLRVLKAMGLIYLQRHNYMLATGRRDRRDNLTDLEQRIHDTLRNDPTRELATATFDQLAGGDRKEANFALRVLEKAKLIHRANRGWWRFGPG